MSAALQLPTIWAAAAQQSAWQVVRRTEQPEIESADETEPAVEKKPVVTLAFYRKHTESLLRRYLYASMLVGRAPSILDHPVAGDGRAVGQCVRLKRRSTLCLISRNASLS